MVQSGRRVLERHRKLSGVQGRDIVKPAAHGGIELYFILRGHHEPVASQTLPKRSQPIDILHRVAMVIAESHCSRDTYPCRLQAPKELVRPADSAENQSAVHRAG